MKKTIPIKELLGFDQNEMASLLNISRSHWSMYETGKRDLPIAAKYLLADMLTHAQSTNVSLKSQSHVARQYSKQMENLERLIHKNNFQRLLITRKINAAKKKYAVKLKALQMVEYLMDSSSKKESFDKKILQSINNKAIKSLEAEGVSEIFSYELKQELLQLEKLLLEAKLRKLTANPEQTGGKE